MLGLSRALLLGTMLLGPVAALAATPAYHLAETIPLGGGVKWDYLYFDPASDRLYVSHGTELTVVDVTSGKIIGRVTGLQGSHGITIDPQTKLGYADSSDTRTISTFDPNSFQILKTMPALEDADGEAFDAATDQVFVAGGDANAVLAVDAMTIETKKLIALGGSPEFLVIDGGGNLFLNIHDKNQIVRIDTTTDAITARWNLPGCEKPTGLAIDPASHRLFSSCQNSKLIVLDSESGKAIALLPIGKGSDAARFDPKDHLIFSSNRDGSLSIIHEVSPREFVAAAPLKTAPGARTMEFDPKTGDLFLVTADILSITPPASPGGRPAYKFQPGSLKLLVYQPAKSSN